MHARTHTHAHTSLICMVILSYELLANVKIPSFQLVTCCMWETTSWIYLKLWNSLFINTNTFILIYGTKTKKYYCICIMILNISENVYLGYANSLKYFMSQVSYHFPSPFNPSNSLNFKLLQFFLNRSVNHMWEWNS